MGIYADLAKKREAQYDVALEGRVRAWLEGVIGHPLEGETFRDGLLDMTALCELVLKAKPGSIQKVHRSKILAFRRENFGSFARVAQELGLKSHDLCTFEDIYDNRNMNQCLVTLIALARIIQYREDYQGPLLEDAKKESVAHKTEFTEQQLREAREAVPLSRKNLAEGQKVIDEAHTVHHGVILDPDNEVHNRK